MDNFFEILIYLIIIVSFLSSFFKKKEQPKPNSGKTKAGSDNSNQRAGDSVYAESKQEEYDILKEIENLFKTGGESPLPSQPKSQQTTEDYYKDNAIKDRDLETISDERFSQDIEKRGSAEYKYSLEEKAPLERKTAIEQQSVDKRRIKVDAKTEKNAEKFAMVLSALDKKTHTQNEFIRKIKNPVTIREYILFSEILGKPKSLRR